MAFDVWCICIAGLAAFVAVGFRIADAIERRAGPPYTIKFGNISASGNSVEECERMLAIIDNLQHVDFGEKTP